MSEQLDRIEAMLGKLIERMEEMEDSAVWNRVRIENHFSEYDESLNMIMINDADWVRFVRECKRRQSLPVLNPVDEDCNERTDFDEYNKIRSVYHD